MKIFMRWFFIFYAFVLLVSCQKESSQNSVTPAEKTEANPANNFIPSGPVVPGKFKLTFAPVFDSLLRPVDSAFLSSYPDCFAEATDDNYPSYYKCQGMRVYVALDSFRMLDIYLNEQHLDLQTTCKTFNIADYPTSDISVCYATYAHAKDSTYFNDCDYIIPLGYKAVWQAVSGTVTVVVSKPYKYRSDEELFQVSFNLGGVRFIRNNSTQDTTIQSLTLKDRSVAYVFLQP